MYSHGHTHGDEFEAPTLSELVDATLYRQMIGSLMYLTNNKLDI
jgi:hypothetical protein